MVTAAPCLQDLAFANCSITDIRAGVQLQRVRKSSEIGSTANSYEILSKLATGGMADIFIARAANAVGIERYVVLKRVLREHAKDAHFVRMFLDEARLVAQLQHPNIAQVYDLGKLGDSYFFTMEYVHGATVRMLISESQEKQRSIPIASVLAMVAGVAAGLHHAHERRDVAGRALEIVHRDITPSNLMVSYEGAVKIVDFGVAKAAHRTHETASGTVKGKISYLSPEQCRGAEIDRRSDLFSLGIVMWELLTLDRLYARASDFEQMSAIVHEQPPAPSTVNSDVPRELDEVVAKLLEKDPARRFQTADELHTTLEGVAVLLGFALSGASLGRFVHELLGERPEPWLVPPDAATDVITLTAEPVAPDLPTDDSKSAEAPPQERSAVAPSLSPIRASLADLLEPEPKRPIRRRTVAAVLVGAASLAVFAAIVTRRAPAATRARDASVIAASPDAAIDAAQLAVAVPADASVLVPTVPPVADPPEIAMEPATTPPHVSAPRPRTRTPDDVPKLFEAEKFADVIARCSANAAVLAASSTQCVLAACRVHDAAHARRWLKAAPKKSALSKQCSAAGTTVESAAPDCASDPLSCQH
jgi:serine/threonine protein kinase